jgi:inorganic triphosphatase YgiF
LRSAHDDAVKDTKNPRGKRAPEPPAEELELKFQVPEAALASLRDALRAHGARAQRLRAHYFDTPNGRLARARIALRLRLEGRHWIQTLKAEGQGIAHRMEHEVRVVGAPGRVPALDVHRHDDSDAGKVLVASLQAAPNGGLVERFATDVMRLACVVRDETGGAVEAALDLGQVSGGGRSAPIAELELEHRAGPTSALFQLAIAWIRHGGLWLSATTKAERGERLLQPQRLPAPVKAMQPQLAHRADGAAVMRAVLQATLQQVVANAGLIAEGSEHAETIHQLRVGLRRLRTVLRELAPLSPAIRPEWATVLSAAFGQLGQRRDHDVVSAAVRPLLQAVQAPLLTWSPPERVDPVAVVRDATFQVTLVQILALAHGEAAQFAALTPDATRALLARLLNDLHRKVERDGRRFQRLPLEQQHRVRKRLKRLRYLAELTGSLWPGHAVQAYLKRMNAAQDALGHHNDVAVAAAAFRLDARERPAAWFAAGYLQAHLAVTARAAGKALAKILDAKPFWR